MARELGTHGFRVATAEDAARALQLMREQRADLAVISLDLPDMDALQLIEGLRALSPLSALVLGQSARPRDVVQALNAGADDYVVRSVYPDELAARLRALLRRGPATAALVTLLRSDDVEIDLPR